MRKAVITVQENQISKSQIRELDEIIRRNYRRYVSAEKLTTVWCRVPQGQMFTNYEESNSSLVTMECPEEFAQEQRIHMMEACEKEWLSVTQQHPDELMIAIIEPELMGTLMQSNRARLSSIGQKFLALNMMKALLKSRIFGSPMSFNPNL
ncbi:MAG: hypothetical protein AAF387_06920 [Pseudomonadota bacterium]